MTASRTGGSSGMAAIADEMPARTFSPSGWPRRKPRPLVRTMRPMATTSRIRTSRSSSRWSGDRRRSREARPPAIRPNSVAAPDGDHDRPRRGRRRRSSRSRRSNAGSRAERPADRERRRPSSGIDSPVSTLRSSSRRSARDDPDVGRDDVAALEQDDVARHELGGGQDGHRPVATDAGRGSRRVAKRLERPLAAVLGDHVGTDDRQQAGEHEQPVTQLADEDRQEPGRRQHEHEWLRRRTKDHPPDRLPSRRVERVRAARGGPPTASPVVRPIAGSTSSVAATASAVSGWSWSSRSARLQSRTTSRSGGRVATSAGRSAQRRG